MQKKNVKQFLTVSNTFYQIFIEYLRYVLQKENVLVLTAI
jgi:hypothetical protein